MQPSSLAITHVGMAGGAALLMVWVIDASPELKAIAVLGGVALGAWAGVVDARAIERRIDRRGGVVLYMEDSVPYALLWPLGIISLTPFAFGASIRAAARSSDVQIVLQVMICGLAAAWFAHDVSVVRRLRRTSIRRGPLNPQWFYGRSVVGSEGMIGKVGEVTSSCAPAGYVRIGSELWRAESIDGSPLIEGQRVIVRRLNGLVVTVEPADPLGGCGQTRKSHERRSRRSGAALASSGIGGHPGHDLIKGCMHVAYDDQSPFARPSFWLLSRLPLRLRHSRAEPA